MHGQGGASQALLIVIVYARVHRLGDHDLDAKQSNQIDQVLNLKNIVAIYEILAVVQRLNINYRGFCSRFSLLGPITYIYVSYLAEHSSLRKGRVSQPFIF